MECILVPKGASQQNQLPCLCTLSSCLPEPENPNSSKSISTFFRRALFLFGSPNYLAHLNQICPFSNKTTQQKTKHPTCPLENSINVIEREFMECILVPKEASQRNQLPCLCTLSSCLPEPGNPNSSKSISTFSEEACFCLGSSTSSTHTERQRDIDRADFPPES
ncbi:hypothetical protein CEXT_487101 [Caerostris extrusa]|uniref:Uncharacterized protein n=1 Tax=Caerostris extrusa TaxID=172846 RepID=A0AAV4MH76_CAEEX|nr:hypothetical protein CEXT_487101 [Caerostris extrusa]